MHDMICPVRKYNFGGFALSKSNIVSVHRYKYVIVDLSVPSMKSIRSAAMYNFWRENRNLQDSTLSRKTWV